MQQLNSATEFPRVTAIMSVRRSATGSPARPDQSCVLVVDDDGGVRAVVARVLETAGITVLVAADGFEALELLDREDRHIDLVLTDVSMPRLGGIELGREIAARQRPIPVLYMSANPPEVLPSSAGLIQQFLLKPFSINRLLTTIGQLLPLHATTALPNTL